VFSFGSTEIIVLMVFALLLFGPDKLPQLARTIGRFMREFNKYKDIMESTIRMEMSRTEAPAKDEPTIEDRIGKAAGASTAIIEKSRAESGPEPEAEDEDADATPSGAATAGAAHPVARASADESDEEDQG
jgi:sec-independent protein translocase protein TatB